MPTKTSFHAPPLPVVQYIRQAKSLGLTNTIIRGRLRKAGWQTKDIELALAFVSVKRKRGPIVKSGRKSNKKSVLTSRLILIICTLLITGSGFALVGYHFVFNNWRLGNISYLELVYSNFANDLKNNSFQIVVNYEDPFSTSLKQGSARLNIDKLKAALTLTSFTADQRSASGSWQLATANGRDKNSFTGSYVYGNNSMFFTLIPENFGRQPKKFQSVPPEQWLQTREGQELRLPQLPFSKLAANAVYRGTDVQDGVRLLRYTLTPDIGYFQNFLRSIQFSNEASDIFNVDQKIVAEVASLYGENFVITGIDVWVRAWSANVEKISLQANAPSVAAISSNAVKKTLDSNSNIAAARLLTQIFDIQSKLEDFKNKNGGYPAAKAGSVPNIPIEWPAPTTTESCPASYRHVYYTTEGKPNTKGLYPAYNISFCLDQAVGDLEAGIGIASPSGLITQTTCSNGEQCFSPLLEVEQPESLDPASTFAAKLTLTITNTHQKNQPLPVPMESIPLSTILDSN